MDWALAIHGGAGAIPRGTPDAEPARIGLEQALAAGARVLRAGGPALDAVQAAIQVLERCPVFNAGLGAVVAEHGGVELDAALMDGARRFGGVAGVRTTQSPIDLAREVLDDGQHVLLAGPGADAWARSRGLAQVDPAWFLVPARQEQQRRIAARGGVDRDHDDPTGTVGAVARDSRGGLAAGNSTGGLVNKRGGRVGDSPICGAGTYADDRSCAVAATGDGELFIRTVAAHRISALVELAGSTLAQASAQVLDEVAALGGSGGVVALGRTGDPVLCFNSGGMYRGWCTAEGSHTAIG